MAAYNAIVSWGLTWAPKLKTRCQCESQNMSSHPFKIVIFTSRFLFHSDCIKNPKT